MENTRAEIKKTLKTYSYDEMSPSAHLIGSNNDLLTEILVRLPATSILRFKCLSKDWQSLFSHRRFTLRNDKLSISPGLFVLNKYVPFDNEYRTPPPFRSLDFYPDVNGIRILQSCNGLLLCCSRQGHTRDRMYYVFNPTTKQFAIIPLVYSHKPDRFVGLAYHQTSCPHYKVFCITFSYSCPSSDLVLAEIQIYSSDTRKWKNLNHYFSKSFYNAPFGNGVYWNGAVYWIPSDCNYLSYFDLKLEKLKELPIPSPEKPMGRYGYRSTYLYYGESRGHLHWVATAKYEYRIYLLVYEMSGDHSGWFVKYKSGDS
ncbi:F-box protein At5g07610-like [Bidens hawaiensis]|uniref:F-box protein At5g07610-like n=1 Tax=Bidens hawaiensis TaxID=980011 RepID=UPI00404AB93B